MPGIGRSRGIGGVRKKDVAADWPYFRPFLGPKIGVAATSFFGGCFFGFFPIFRGVKIGGSVFGSKSADFGQILGRGLGYLGRFWGLGGLKRADFGRPVRKSGPILAGFEGFWTDFGGKIGDLPIFGDFCYARHREEPGSKSTPEKRRCC